MDQLRRSPESANAAAHVRPDSARDGRSTGSAQLEACGFFVLRAPLLSVDAWRQWCDTGDLAGQRAQLRAQLERPEVREAIAVASPSLLVGLPQWIREPQSEGGQKIERALVRYLSRMSTRPTPFGLFAGCGVGTIGARTGIRVGPSAAHRRRTRLDNDYLDQLARRVSKSPELRHALRYRPNSSLYEGGGKMRYVVPRFSGTGRTFDLAVLDLNEYLDVALLIARAGATAIEIAQAIVDHDPEVTHADALGFVDGLVDAYVLVSELEPTVTGREPIHEMIASLEPVAAASEVVATLVQVRDTLANIDGERLGQAHDARYAAMAETLAQLCEGADTRRLLQVDMQLGL
ncbi:MAG: lantibiotic dehydratase, partial [Deltaproteobacteria bacterium]|nr:lantibiotic dehydratase [Nannocystaceae bacterium]